MSLALYRKYRPRTFAEVIGQEHVTEPLSQALRSGRLHHAYLFSGPRGCGKTSSARILARSLNCEQGPTPEPCGVCASCRSLANDGVGSIDVIEIDAASHGGVDDARDLREKAFFAPASSRYKIYVIDEAHMVSSAGFNALLKLVEEPPDYVKFIFATTEPEKVLGTIKSRTHHYPFRLIPPAVLRPYLQQLTEAEGIAVEPAVFPLVVRAGGGSARDSLSVLDQLISGAGPDGVSYARAVALLGVTDVTLLDDMCDALAAGDGATAFATIDRVAEAGHDPRRFASDLLERFRDLIVLQQVPDAVTKGLIDGPADQLEAMAAQATRLGPATLSRSADIVHNGLVEMRGTTAPRLLLELITARMLLPGADDSAGALLQRLERMERRLTLTPDSVRGELPPASSPEAGVAGSPGTEPVSTRSGVAAPGGEGGARGGLSAARAAAAAASRRGSTAAPGSARAGAEVAPATPATAEPTSTPAEPSPAAVGRPESPPTPASGSGAGSVAEQVEPEFDEEPPWDDEPEPDFEAAEPALPVDPDSRAGVAPLSASSAQPSGGARANVGARPDGREPADAGARAEVSARAEVGAQPDGHAPADEDARPEVGARPDGHVPADAGARAEAGAQAAGARADAGAPAGGARANAGASAGGSRAGAGARAESDFSGGAEADSVASQSRAGAEAGSGGRAGGSGRAVPPQAARRSEPAGVLPDAPEEPGAAAVNLGVPGALDVVAVREVWPEIVTAIGRQSKKVAALASGATVRDLDGDTVVLTFRFPAHAKMVAPEATVISNALYEALGGRWQIRCEVAGEGGAIAPVSGGPASGGSVSGGSVSGGPEAGAPGRNAPSQGAPGQGGPGQGAPGQGGPGQGAPSQGGPSQGGPSQGGPSQGGPSQGGPSQGGPNQGGPSQSAPSQSPAGQSGAGRSGPGQSGGRGPAGGNGGTRNEAAARGNGSRAQAQGGPQAVRASERAPQSRRRAEDTPPPSDDDWPEPVSPGGGGASVTAPVAIDEPADEVDGWPEVRQVGGVVPVVDESGSASEAGSDHIGAPGSGPGSRPSTGAGSWAQEGSGRRGDRPAGHEDLGAPGDGNGADFSSVGTGSSRTESTGSTGGDPRAAGPDSAASSAIDRELSDIGASPAGVGISASGLASSGPAATDSAPRSAAGRPSAANRGAEASGSTAAAGRGAAAVAGREGAVPDTGSPTAAAAGSAALAAAGGGGPVPGSGAAAGGGGAVPGAAASASGGGAVPGAAASASGGVSGSGAAASASGGVSGSAAVASAGGGGSGSGAVAAARGGEAVSGAVGGRSPARGSGGGGATSGLAAARAAAAAAANARAAGGRPQAKPAAAATTATAAWNDGSPAEEAPYDPEYDGPPGRANGAAAAGYDGFDPGDEPLDVVIDEKTARESGEQQAMRLLQEAFGAEKIGES